MRLRYPSSLLLFSVAALVGRTKAATADDWKALNSTVEGRLQRGVPYSQPCFTILEGNITRTPNPTECSAVQKGNTDHIYRTSQFGSYDFTQWETCQTTNEQCLLDYTNVTNPAAFAPPQVCYQGSVPDYYIDVKGPNEVIAALNFTRNTKVPLVIKNTGHDYHGRSSAPGSLALWTHNLRKLSYAKSFISDGCSPNTKPQSAITIGAGQQLQEINDFALANNVTFLAGVDPSVGASGGWIQGGGHSALTPALGLGVDRVLEFKVVTPDGVYRTVNQCQNQDLFFALRGGGGGTYGVVLESTHMASPLFPVQVLVVTWQPSATITTPAVKLFASHAVAMNLDGWGGYITPPVGHAVWINPLLNETDARQSTASLASGAASLGFTVNYSSTKSFNEVFTNIFAQNVDPVGRAFPLVSRLIPADRLNNASVVDAITHAFENVQFPQILAVGANNFKGYTNGTSVTPAWRNAVWHVLSSNQWNYDATPQFRADTYRNLTHAFDQIRSLTPSSGAYFNEADVYEPDWQNSFWGPNYPALLKIKRKYDPDGILDCWHCVGWNGTQDARYKCYPKI